jgi:hypothetical protein
MPDFLKSRQITFKSTHFTKKSPNSLFFNDLLVFRAIYFFATIYLFFTIIYLFFATIYLFFATIYCFLNDLLVFVTIYLFIVVTEWLDRGRRCLLPEHAVAGQHGEPRIKKNDCESFT